MQDKMYLLWLGEETETSVSPGAEEAAPIGKEQLPESELSELNKKCTALLERALGMLDEGRLRKLSHIKWGRKRLESIGGGLLLQLAVREALAESEPAEKPKEMSKEMRRITLEELIEALSVYDMPLDLEYRYGEHGKPYLVNYPYYFSISHSGAYVFCVLSDREVGVDIQQKTDAVNERVLQRFFAPEEKLCWEKLETVCEKRDFFYRLWCRKEAYGKFTGNGIGDAVSVNMCAMKDRAEASACIFREYDCAEGYQIAVCHQSVSGKNIE